MCNSRRPRELVRDRLDLVLPPGVSAVSAGSLDSRSVNFVVSTEIHIGVRGRLDLLS